MIPRYLSNHNCVEQTGQKMPWLLAAAGRLGVKVHKDGRKRLIPAGEFFAALEREEQAEARGVPLDYEAELLKRLGLERVR